jgi:DNA invertase Pin-like site-specific DNA recombinase
MSDNGKQGGRVWGYARASTKKQVDSPDAQKETIRKYASLLELGDVTYFVDAAKSGKVSWEDRDAGKELFQKIRPGDHVIVSKLDRAFRRLADCVLVLEKFKRMGVKLHVANMLGGAIDLSSPMGLFLIHILAAFAELERAFISERTKEGLANRKRKNVAYCRFPGYGQKWEKRWVDGKLVKVKIPDDEERAVMCSILGWRTQDVPLGWDEIRRHLTCTLKLKTKDGREWDVNRIRRACRAELLLRQAEQREHHE